MTSYKFTFSSPRWNSRRRALQTRCIIHEESIEWKSASQFRLFLLPSIGGSSQPGGGVSAAVQHALPHAVVVRAGAPSAQCGRGLASSAD